MEKSSVAHFTDDEVTIAEHQLKDYRREKLILGEGLLSLLDIAHRRRDEGRATQIRELAGRLAEDRFQLGVVGQFSRGKSTLMNAILGAPYLPSGALPMTSVVATVTYGSTTRAVVQRGPGHLPIETPIGDLARYVAQSSTTREELGVTSALVELPAEILRLGLCFVDTPGVGSAISANTETTLAFLPDADAVIFVTSFDSPLTEAELSFLDHVRRVVPRIFVVLNKRDLIGDSEAREVHEFVKSEMKAIGFEEPRIFELSAREGLDARVHDDDEGVEASGVGAFESELVDYLTTEKAKEFLLRVSERAERSAHATISDLQLAGMLGTDEAARTRAEHELDEIASSFNDESARLLSVLRKDLSEQLSAVRVHDTAQWKAQLAHLLRGASDIGRTRPGIGQRRRTLQSAREALQGRAQDVVAAWSARTIEECLTGAEAKHHSVVSEVGKLADRFGVDAILHFGVVSDHEPSFESGDGPHLAVPSVEWTVPVLDRGWLAGWRTPIRVQVDDLVQQTIDAEIERMFVAVRAGFDGWVSSLEDWSLTRLHLRRDSVRKRLFASPDPQLDAELASISRAVTDARERIAGWSIERGPNRTTSITVTRKAPPRAAGCVVCDDLVRALFTFMAHYQFELATSIERRVAHAAVGFCPMHTWYYAEIGSPIGISSAYAGLAEERADQLDAAEQGAHDPTMLSAALARTGSPREECPACAHLERTEREALQHLRTGLSTAPPQAPLPALCVDHTGRLVASGLDIVLCRRIVANTAELLRRRSEDMRTFALKRESLRRGLLDREEEAAYRDVLLRLAGDPLLAGAPRNDSEFASPYRGAKRRRPPD